MRFTARMVVLAATVSLPLGAALASYALAGEPAAPQIPADVRIGEAGGPGPPARGPGTSEPTPTSLPAPPAAVVPDTAQPPAPAAPRPATKVVPPPPVADDDDDDDDDRGDDDGDDN